MASRPHHPAFWEDRVAAWYAPCAFVQVTEGIVRRRLAAAQWPEEFELPVENSPFAPDGAGHDVENERLTWHPFPLFGEGWFWAFRLPGGGAPKLGALGDLADRLPFPAFVLNVRGRLKFANAHFRRLTATPAAGKPAASPRWEGLPEEVCQGNAAEIHLKEAFGYRFSDPQRTVLVPVYMSSGRQPVLVLGGMPDHAAGPHEHRRPPDLLPYQKIYEDLPEGLIVLDAEGLIQSANSIVCDRSGVPLKDMAGKPILQFFPEDQHATLKTAMQNCLKTGRVVRTEVLYRHFVSGDTIRVFLTVTRMSGAAGPRLLLLLEDRTRWRLLESPSHAAEKRYEKLFQSAPDLIFTCLLDGTVLLFNKRCEELLGWSPALVKGGQIGQDVPNLPLSLFTEWLRRVERAEASVEPVPLRSQCRLKDAAGVLRTFQVQAVPYQDDLGRLIGITIHLHDETANRLLQERLAESRERFRSLVENSSDVIFQLTPALEVLYVNPAALNVLGISPAEWVGRPIKLEAFLAADQLAHVKGMSAQKILKGGLQGETLRFRRHDGSQFWGQLSLIPIRHGRRIRSLLGVLRDVDDFYKAREELERQHTELEQTINQLEEASRVQEQFVANVTHELRTPLTTILVTSEVLERYMSETATPIQRRQMDLVRKNARILLDLINDLLDLAKLKHGKIMPREKIFSLEKFVGDLKDVMEPLFAQKSLDFAVVIGDDVPANLSTDPDMLRKVIINLLSNAYKFTEEGRVLLEVLAVDSELRLRVTDTGAGIEEKDLARIFDEFRQVDSSDTRRQEGTGLGLSIVDRFVTLLGGRVDVLSTPGKGSTFSISFPLSHISPRYT